MICRGDIRAPRFYQGSPQALDGHAGDVGTLRRVWTRVKLKENSHRYGRSRSVMVSRTLWDQWLAIDGEECRPHSYAERGRYLFIVVKR